MQRGAQQYGTHPGGVPGTNLSDALRLLASDPQRALESAEILLARYGKKTACYVPVAHLKTRALLQLHRTDDCLAFISSLAEEVQGDKRLLMSKGRALHTQGHLSEALSIFQYLYTTHRATDRQLKLHGLALGRLLQSIGGTENLEQALAIYTQLRTQAAQGREHTPCDDKDIELTLGRHLQIMGGADNMDKALEIFSQLRTRAANGKVDTACDDKNIELTLGRHLQRMGGGYNQQQALAIFTGLRTKAARGGATPFCNDKAVELALGIHLQSMGGEDNLENSLTILTRLRAHAAGGQVNQPCDDKEI